MLHPDDRNRVLKAWHHSVTTGTPYEQEERPGEPTVHTVGSWRAEYRCEMRKGA